MNNIDFKTVIIGILIKINCIIILFFISFSVYAQKTTCQKTIEYTEKNLGPPETTYTTFSKFIKWVDFYKFNGNYVAIVSISPWDPTINRYNVLLKQI